MTLRPPLLLVLMLTASLARAADSSATTPDMIRARNTAVFTAYFENDFFSGTDRHYTNGTKFSWISSDYSSWKERGDAAGTVGDALPDTEPGSRRHADLTQLQIALARFVAIQYGRIESSIDEAAVDESLGHGLALARRLKVQHLWPVRKLSALTGTATELGKRVWSR